MGYLVISCYHCGAPRVAEKGRQTTQCTRCSARLQLDKVLVHAETESAAEARDAVGQVNAQKADGELLRAPEAGAPSPGDALDDALTQAREVTARSPRVRLAAQGLTEVFGRFTRDQWLTAMERLDVPEARAEEQLEKLIQANMLAEPERGQFEYLG